LVQALRSQGVTVEEWSYTAQRYGEMASILFALLRDQRIDLYDDEGLLDELRNVRLQETNPGQVRIQHDPGRHDDRCVAIGMAIVPLVRQGSGHVTLQVAEGVLPASPTFTRQKSTQAPPVPVVHPGEQRPVEKLYGSFAAARRHRDFQTPGPR
jgi:hypothetical protein